LTSNLSKTSALTFYFSRSKDADKNWSTQLYCFLNFTIGDSLFGSAFYEKESETKRLTVISDNGNKIESLKISGGVDDNKSTQDGNIDLQYNTQFADFGIKEELIRPKNQDTGSRTTLKFLSAFSFVTNGKDYGLSVSRPIANSFVIFKPNSTWVGQSFGVRSLSNDNESKTGLFGESLVSGLIPYQYRRVQLDPSSLDPGYTLAQESFVVYPKLRSGHLFVIGKSGLIVLRGKLTDKAQRPLALKVGFFTSLNGKTIPFFTGREGEILIEGIEPSLGKIEIDDEHFDSLEINLKNAKIGMFDIGVIELPFKN
jgi:outer membrane usher protein FimD/PapC